MASLTLTVDDIQKILSSLLLAELSYSDRMHFSQGSSLTSEFIPSSETLKDIDAIKEKALAIFNLPVAICKTGTTLREWAVTIHAEWEKSNKHITFFTSGSTGLPKPNTHNILLHEQEATALAQIFHGRQRVISFVPHHHIYGFLFSILLPKALNIPIISHSPLPTIGIIKELTPGDLVVAFPLLWNKLSDMNIRFDDDIHGVTSTGPCPAETIATLRRKRLDSMYEIYGSSETGGVGYRNELGGYKLLPHWSTGSDASLLSRTKPNGQKCDYELQDILEWDNDKFLPTKRNDDGVQVAGVNVFPSRVKDIIKKHPCVNDCTVRLMRPNEGARLKVLIVLNNPSNKNEIMHEIRKWAKNQLTQYEYPAKWDFAHQLPINNMGKNQDW